MTDLKTTFAGLSQMCIRDRVKGTLHWVSCNHCLQAEVRLYDRLWKVENPRDELAAIREAKKCEALEAMKEIINPDSLKVLPNCYIEKFAVTLPPLSYLQFQRIGYFNIDKESTSDKLIFNRTVGLKEDVYKRQPYTYHPSESLPSGIHHCEKYSGRFSTHSQTNT